MASKTEIELRAREATLTGLRETCERRYRELAAVPPSPVIAEEARCDELRRFYDTAIARIDNRRAAVRKRLARFDKPAQNT